MEAKAKGEFLKKISINGFSIEDKGDVLVLHPRGQESEAEITIQETEDNQWKVVSATGKFTGFARGQKRKFFENNITEWALSSVLQAHE